MKRYLMLPLMLLTACEGTNLHAPTTKSERTALSEKTALSQQKTKVRIATFNVSMEALNYLPHVEGQAPQVQGNELANSLAANHQQIRNIAEIIQRINPDIILLNEFDRQDDTHQALQTFLQDYLAKSQQGQKPQEFPYFFQGPVNTGVPAPFDVNNNGTTGESPADTYGFGFFPRPFRHGAVIQVPRSRMSRSAPSSTLNGRICRGHCSQWIPKPTPPGITTKPGSKCVCLPSLTGTCR